MKKNKKWIGLVGLSATAIVLAGCSGQSDAGSDGVTIKVWSWQSNLIEQYERIFDVYEAANPGVTVEFEAFQSTEYNQILATGLQGNDGPDVPMLRAAGGAQGLIASGQLAPITDDVEGLSNFDEVALASARGAEDGEVYGVPYAIQTLQMFYNKTMFDELGLEEPTTWDEFIEVNDALVAEGITPLALGAREDWVVPIFSDVLGSARYGGAEFIVAVEAGDTDFTDPAFVDSLQIVDDMREYLSPDVAAFSYDDALAQMTTGQAGQYPGGSYGLSSLQQGAPDIEWGVYQVPLAPDAASPSPVSPSYADGSFGLSAKSEVSEEALALLEWFTTEEFGQLVADELAQFSPLPGLTYSDPLLQEMKDLYEASPAPYVTTVGLGDPTATTTLLGTNIQAMFQGQETPEGVARAFQEGIATWFTPIQ